MKIFHKTLLCSVLIITPIAVVQAHETEAQHQAWIRAQKIDIQPTITIKETQIPASSVPGSYSQPVAPGAQSSGGQSGYTVPGTGNHQSMPGSAPIEDHSGMQNRSGMQNQGGMRTQ